MKMRVLLTLAGLAIGFAVPALAQEQNTVDPEVRQQIEAALTKFDEAFNRNDASAIADQFRFDAVDVWAGAPDGGMVFGQQAIQKRYAAESASGINNLAHKLLQVYAIGNDICAITEWSQGVHSGGHYAVTIYVRDADEWKVRMHYVN
jgi:ketosteroid isomerase-like protein